MAKAKSVGEVWQGTPDTTWTYNDALHGTVELVSDGSGSVPVSTEAERTVAAAFGLTAPEGATPQQAEEPPAETGEGS